MKNALTTIATKARSFSQKAYVTLMTDSRARRAAMIAAVLLLSTVTATAGGGGATAIAGQLQTTANPYINLGIRLFGGLCGIGGLVVGFNGITGNEEGYQKVVKIGTGLIGIALGVVCIAQTTTIRTMLNLDTMFSTT